MRRAEKTVFVRWVEFVTAGTMLGLAAAVWVGSGAIARAVDLPAIPALLGAIAVMAVAGFAEGSLVGLAQASVLGRTISGFRPGYWVITTGAATALAWALGMRANVFAVDRELGPVELIAFVVALGAVFGAIVGTVQWLQLRRRLAASVGWIAANSVAWVMGSLIALGGLALLGPETQATELVVTGVVVALMVGAAVGVITGTMLIALVRLPAPRGLIRH